MERILEELMNEAIFEPEEIEETVRSMANESTLTEDQEHNQLVGFLQLRNNYDMWQLISV